MLKKVLYRPHPINGCLTATSLTLEPDDYTHYEFILVEQRHGRLRRARRRVHVRASTRTRLSEARTTIVGSTAGTQRTWSPFTT